MSLLRQKIIRLLLRNEAAQALNKSPVHRTPPRKLERGDGRSQSSVPEEFLRVLIEQVSAPYSPGELDDFDTPEPVPTDPNIVHHHSTHRKARIPSDPNQASPGTDRAYLGGIVERRRSLRKVKRERARDRKTPIHRAAGRSRARVFAPQSPPPPPGTEDESPNTVSEGLHQNTREKEGKSKCLEGKAKPTRPARTRRL